MYGLCLQLSGESSSHRTCYAWLKRDLPGQRQFSFGVSVNRTYLLHCTFTRTCTGDMPPDEEAAGLEESSPRSPRTPAVASRGIAAARSASRGKGFVILTFTVPCNTRFEVTVNLAKRRFERSLGLGRHCKVPVRRVVGGHRPTEIRGNLQRFVSRALVRVEPSHPGKCSHACQVVFLGGGGGAEQCTTTLLYLTFPQLYPSYTFTLLTPLTPLTPLRLSSYPRLPLVHPLTTFHPGYPFYAAYFFYLACPLTPLTFLPWYPV